MKRRNVKDNVENQINGSTRASTPTINKKIIGVGVDALIDPLKNRAITLIALIITIIIMLILAGVVLSLTIGENGLFSTAKYAVKKWNNSVEQENAELDELYVYINGENLPENTKDTNAGTLVAVPDSWKTSTPSYVRTSDGKEVVSSKKISTVQAVATGDGETVPVPLGFYYVGGKVSTGVVISDSSSDKYDGKTDKTSHEYAPNLKGNQFVWIPCKLEDYHKINWGKENTNWDMETHESEYNQVKKYEGFYIGRYEAGVSTLNEETNEFKDSVTFNNNASLFNVVALESGYHGWSWQNYSFTARKEVTPVTTGENKASGNIVSKANSIPYYHADYYTAKEMSRRMYSDNKYVYSGLTSGTQWDMMMKYLQEKGDKVNVTSSNWGNYDNVSLENLRGYYTNVTTNGVTDGFKEVGSLKTNAGTSSYVLLTTGSTEQVMKNNLYDVAGNLWEWTEEASYADNLDYNNDPTYNTYVVRGGSFSHDYATLPAWYRAYGCAPDAYTYHGFRPTLYMK